MQPKKLTGKRTVEVSKRLAAAAALASLMSGCSPMAAQFKDDGGVAKKDIPLDKAAELQCLDNQPDYVLNTDILYFQMTDKYGAKVGVNALGGLLRAIGFGVEYATGDLSTAMHLLNPLNTTVPISDRTGTATATKLSFDVNFGINIVDLGFSYYTTTSLAVLSQDAMKDNLKNIVADIKDEWTTHVSHVYNSSEIEIPVGTKAGVQAGDTFAIYDVEWEFTGNAPCQGPLKIARRLSPNPIATAVVTQRPSPTTAILMVLPGQSGKSVSMYNLVTVSQLAPTGEAPTCTTDFWGNQTCTDPAARAALKRSVRVGPVSGKPILFDTGSGNVKIDITPFAGQQLTTIVNDPEATYGLYLMQ